MPSTEDERDDHDEEFEREEQASIQKAFRRMGASVTSGPVMKRFAAAAAMLLTGKRGRDMRAPEPLVQVGFEPDETDMRFIVDMAKSAGRDLIHVSCQEDGTGEPIGMVAVVYFEDGKARAHRRGGLVSVPGTPGAVIASVSDDEDEICHFVLSPGKKMVRVLGYPTDELLEAMKGARRLWLEKARTLEGGDFSDEILRIAGIAQGPGGPAKAA